MFFFFFLLNLSGGLWQSWLREVPQFPECGWLWNSGWPWRCSLHPNVLVRRWLGLGFLGAYFSSPWKALFVSLLSCGRIGLMLSTGRLAYPDVSILNMGEMIALSPQVQTGPRGSRLEKLFLALWYLEIKYIALSLRVCLPEWAKILSSLFPLAGL